MKRASEPHLKFIRSLPCLICGNDTQTEAAHIRFGDLRAAKPQTGIGIKPSDSFTVPLCGAHHREQHEGSEREFWRRHKIDPIFVALALWQASADHEAGEQIVRHAYFHS